MDRRLFLLRDRLQLYAVTLLFLLPILFVGWMAVTYVERAGWGGGHDYEASEWGTRTEEASEGRTRTREASERGTRAREASESAEMGTRTSDYSTDLGNGYFDDGTGSEPAYESRNEDP